MKNVFIALGGQTIRQNQDLGNNRVEIIKIKANYDEKGFNPCDSFTDRMWSFDQADIKRWSKDWAYNPDNLEFDVIDKTDDSIIV